MKVLNLLQSSRYSGAENVVFQIISMFKNENVDFVYSSKDGQIREVLEERNITHNLMKEFSLKEIKRVIKEENPDLIHAHDMKASFFASICCGNIPLVCHIHNNSFESQKISLKSLFFYFAGFKSKHIFWVSNSAFKGYIFHKSFVNKSSVLYNTIDIENLINKSAQDTNEYSYDIVYLGRLSEPKNPYRLLEVFREILNKKPFTKIAMIGTGEMEKEIRDIIYKDSILSNIDFYGFMSNPYKILTSSKLMIMVSKWEGTPMCALEAMALGVPIVSTPTDGLKELVDHGSTGYLSNDNQKIIEYCLEIISSNSLRNKLSEASKEKAIKINDLKNYKSSIENVYLKFCKEK